MEVQIGKCHLIIKQGDITKEDTDAIVNAANSRLAGGGGVDGAIHRAGGSKIAEECRKIGSCPTGRAVITSGGNLPASYVIHAVGPIYRGGKNNEAELLRSAYISSLELADKYNLRSVAFPSISTGAYGYPIKEASRIALQAIIDYCESHPQTTIEEIRFVLFTPQDKEVYIQSLEELMENFSN